jgi:hypothetical protein
MAFTSAFRAIAATSGERVTTTRDTRAGVSVTSSARAMRGALPKSASSLLEPNRTARPDAMMTQPTAAFSVCSIPQTSRNFRRCSLPN